jgi:hypothetical protein
LISAQFVFRVVRIVVTSAVVISGRGVDADVDLDLDVEREGGRNAALYTMAIDSWGRVVVQWYHRTNRVSRDVQGWDWDWVVEVEVDVGMVK